MKLVGTRKKSNEKREQAAQLRHTAEKSRTASDRAFFRRQAQRFDHQAEELEKANADTARGSCRQ